MIIGSISIAVLTGGVGFWGGTMYQKSKSMFNFQNRGEGRTMMQGQNTNTKPSGNGVTPGMPGQIGSRNTTGEVTAKDDKSMTVKMNDGSSRIIILSDKTVYRISEESSLGLITVGTKVAVFGESGADGSVTATNIEINPALMGQILKQ